MARKFLTGLELRRGSSLQLFNTADDTNIEIMYSGTSISIGGVVYSAQRAIQMGKAGTITATMTDAADFLQVVPANLSLTKLKVTRATHGSAASVVQIRKSTDSGASFSNAFGSATFTTTGLVATADPADHNVSEGDILNFSISTGGGSNFLVQLIAVPR